MPDIKPHLHSGMTVLDVVSRFRETETVFRRYDERAGECICCQALFETIQEVAERYHLDLTELLTDLESALPVTLDEGPGIKRNEEP